MLPHFSAKTGAHVQSVRSEYQSEGLAVQMELESAHVFEVPHMKRAVESLEESKRKQ